MDTSTRFQDESVLVSHGARRGLQQEQWRAPSGKHGCREGEPAWLTGVEVVLVPALLMAHLWQLWQWLPLAEDYPGLARCLLPVLAVALVSFSLFRMRERPSSLGLYPANWRQGWPSVFVFTAAGFLVLSGLSLAFGKPAEAVGWSWFRNYAAGMIAQQIALQCFLNNRLQFLASCFTSARADWSAVIGSTLVFALLHAPNIPLTAGTVFGGTFWTWHFSRYRNLPAVCISHLLLGVGAMVLLGHGPLMRLAVGWPAMRMLLEQ